LIRTAIIEERPARTGRDLLPGNIDVADCGSSIKKPGAAGGRLAGL